MDAEIREYIFKHINNFLKKDNLLKKKVLFEKFQKVGLVSSVENAIYGSFVESLLNITFVLNVFEGYSLTPEDMLELLDIIEDRSSEIKSKVSTALTPE
jgi:hypothetical protein